MHIHLRPYQQQKGIALFVVIVIVLISTLFTLWASRSSLFNELVIGNDSDYQRAFEAAQALIQDAELDISRKRPNGDACQAVPGNLKVCRPVNGSNTVWFPYQSSEMDGLLNTLSATTTGCVNGICLKRTDEQDFWIDKNTLNAMIANGVGARYGEFTGAETGSPGSPTSNPILSKTAAGDGGWYWVEIMNYRSNAATSKLMTNAPTNLLELNLVPMVSYRITAIARGLKPGTQVILQSTFVKQKPQD